MGALSFATPPKRGPRAWFKNLCDRYLTFPEDPYLTYLRTLPTESLVRVFRTDAGYCQWHKIDTDEFETARQAMVERLMGQPLTDHERDIIVTALTDYGIRLPPSISSNPLN